MTVAIAHLTIGVADLQPVFDLWVNQIGLETVVRRQGPDPDLARLWGIEAEQIADQVLLRTPGAATGWLHFVQFNNPGIPVRAGAASTDLGPKNIDVNCVDISAKHASLQAAGYRFRSAIREYQVDGIHVREVQMSGPDETNVVLIEVLSEGFETNYSSTGFASVTSFVVIVPSVDIEAKFYTDLLGLDALMRHRIAGPSIEEVVGLPKGAALDMLLMGSEKTLFGRVELINYEGLTGTDRFSLAKPPALGVLHCAFAVKSLDEFIRRANRLDLEIITYDDLQTIYGVGRVCSVFSPAGLRLEVFERH